MQPDRRNPALRIALIYALAAACWILLSDVILTSLLPGALPAGGSPADGPPAARFFALPSILNGLLFVAVTAALLYLLVRDAVASLWRAQARMQLLFDGVNDAVYLYPLGPNGEPGLLLDANTGAQRMSGYSHAELLQMTPLDLVKPTLRRRLRENSRQLIDRRQAVFETVLIAKDGTEIPVEVSIHVNDIEGVPTAFASARDIRDRKQAEAERREAALATERDKHAFYRETILAMSEGKFQLVEPEEARDFIRSPTLHLAFSQAGELREVRRLTCEWARSQGLSEEAAHDFEIAIGEASTNALKHASGGELFGGRDNGSIWIAVVDHGEGIDTFAIPRVAFQSGYTTKSTMGLGYTLMLAVCDRVMLASGPGGTTVIMEKRLNVAPESGHIPMTACPDARR